MSALAEALVAAQAELPCALSKDADGQIQSRTYRYLTLDKLIAETRPILTKHGLTIMQWPDYITRARPGFCSRGSVTRSTPTQSSAAAWTTSSAPTG